MPTPNNATPGGLPMSTADERATFLRRVGPALQSIDLRAVPIAIDPATPDLAPFEQAGLILNALEQWPHFDDLAIALRAYYQAATIFHQQLTMLSTDDLVQLGIQ